MWWQTAVSLPGLSTASCSSQFLQFAATYCHQHHALHTKWELLSTFTARVSDLVLSYMFSLPPFVEARKHFRYKTIIASRGGTPLRCNHSKQRSNDIQLWYAILSDMLTTHILQIHHRNPHHSNKIHVITDSLSMASHDVDLQRFGLEDNCRCRRCK